MVNSHGWRMRTLGRINGCPASHWQEVLYGIEEEGIPYLTAEHSSAGLEEAAYAAAQLSPLLVGIACQRDALVVHYKNLRPESPLYRFSDSHAAPDVLRALGSNAARLVKGLPFKPM